MTRGTYTLESYYDHSTDVYKLYLSAFLPDGAHYHSERFIDAKRPDCQEQLALNRRALEIGFCQLWDQKLAECTA